MALQVQVKFNSPQMERNKKLLLAMSQSTKNYMVFIAYSLLETFYINYLKL